MAEPARRPTADEIERLTEAFRRNPAAAFVQLGQALLALGRPREAVEIGARGLKADPKNLDGRIMVAQAFAALHQWKEAQAELLRVVKADRNHGIGFRLLGEVLMRRADYERALPVLQHAQNLTPADPGVLALVRRARAGQPLDPPPPIPTPMSPAAAGQRQADGAPAVRDLSTRNEFDAMPTRVAGEVYQKAARDLEGAGTLARVELSKKAVRTGAGAGAPQEAGVRRVGYGEDEEAAPSVKVHHPPPTEDVFAPLGESPMRAPAPPPPAPPASPPPAPRHKAASTAPPPQVPPSVRPRVLSAQKPKGAAQASLRQSAAVGEQYLNNLLTAGLVDVPNVRAADVDYEVAPDKRWGRSALRMFIYLFVLLFAGLGGAGFWWYYAEKQKAEDVERLLAEAKSLTDTGDYGDLQRGVESARKALDLDRKSDYALAVFGESLGLAVLLYKEVDVRLEESSGRHTAVDVQRAIDLLRQGKAVNDPADLGYREFLVARATSTLASLHDVEDRDDAVRRLGEVRGDLDAWLASSPEDRLVRWLAGRALDAAGDRAGSAAAFEQAWAGGEGPVMAAIDLADLVLDDGDFGRALELYNAALERSPQNQLAYVGRSLARSERSAEASEAVADLNVGLAEPHGPRVASMKQLAFAIAHHLLQTYSEFDAALDQAVNVEEPRFLARVGLYRVRQGRFDDAARVRTRIRWFGPDPQPHPLVRILDAEIAWATGAPEAALAAVGEDRGLRADMVRGRALFDLGRYEQALAQFESALEVAPEDLWATVWAEASRMVATKSADERNRADERLDSLGRRAVSKAARLPHGIALMRTGKPGIARTKLEVTVQDISSAEPNPLEYRSRVALAELDLRDGKGPEALAHLEKAVAQVPGYLPAEDIMCRLLAGGGGEVDADPERARESCRRVVEDGVASAAAELAWVRTIMPSAAPADRDAAIAALRRAQQKGAGTEALQAAIELVDSSLFEELGVPKPR